MTWCSTLGVFLSGRFLTRTTAVRLSKGGVSCALASTSGMRCSLGVDFREDSGGQDEVASGRGAGTGALKGGVMEGRSLDRRSLRRENAFTPPAVWTSLICMVSRNSRAHSL